ncbi:MAG: DUF72 domain-containing protein [Candidatus Eisenbacteria bacterium]|nr:DUF72 domain-containing protein [Candidatus Eisenbacteria bacterium]
MQGQPEGAMAPIDMSDIPSTLHVGTSSFSETDWKGKFYPAGMPPRDFLAHYAQSLRTVEIDATWYARPSRRTVESWARKVPEEFVFSLKVPKEITHDGYLEDCREPWTAFLRALEPLGDRRGPLLFQFPYIAKRRDPDEYAHGRDFLRRLRGFLPLLPEEGQYVVEVRNEKWLGEELAELLRSRSVALCLSAYYTMPSPRGWFARCDPVTAPFTYLRFLGHRRRMDGLIEKLQKDGKRRKFDEIVVDRGDETRRWVETLRGIQDRLSDIYVYFNNHYAGYAPGSVELFLKIWRELDGGKSRAAGD